MRLLSTTLPMVEDVVSSKAASAETETESVTSPTVSVISTRACCWICSVMPSCRNFLKPAALASTL